MGDLKTAEREVKKALTARDRAEAKLADLREKVKEQAGAVDAAKEAVRSAKETMRGIRDGTPVKKKKAAKKKAGKKKVAVKRRKKRS